MSFKNEQQSRWNFNFCKIFLFSPYFVIFILHNTSHITSTNVSSKRSNYSNNFRRLSKSAFETLRLFKRSSGKFCFNTSDCITDLPGSLCVENTCTCPQGFLPNNEGSVGCFQVGKSIGELCNMSSQCGEELICTNHVCHCPEGFQLYHTAGANLCLFWHRPTRLVERCRSNEDCTSHDSNSICKKHWCQCNVGYQLFETMLFGRKHKCFKTYKQQCINSSQCLKLGESSDQYCFCFFGFCHCMPDTNSTFSDVYSWQNDKPNWYQRWKKDIILATRLLFITVILFFVPCFIYVTLGVRERSRQLFSQFVQPTRPAVHYTQRRSSYVRSSRIRRSTIDAESLTISPSATEAHRVEISLHPNGVNSRLVNYQIREAPEHPGNCERVRETYLSPLQDAAKEDDAPPSYEEIMQNDIVQEAPPPPYREL